MDFKEINFSSTPVKKIRFRGDSFQTETDSLLDNDYSDEVHSLRNAEIPKGKGLFTFLFRLLSKKDTQSFFLRSTAVWVIGLSASGIESRLLLGP